MKIYVFYNLWFSKFITLEDEIYPPGANLSQVKNHWPKPEQRNEVCETDSLVEWLPQMDDSKQKGETTQRISWVCI